MNKEKPETVASVAEVAPARLSFKGTVDELLALADTIRRGRRAEERARKQVRNIPAVLECIQARDTIGAIKAYRDATGAGLKEARDRVLRARLGAALTKRAA
jgi:ribosomal protein L7/L12